MKKLVLIFDTETNDKAKHFKNAEEDLDNYPKLMQIAGNLLEIDLDDVNSDPKFIYSFNLLVKPFRNNILIDLAEGAFKTHGISLQDCIDNGDKSFTVLMLIQGLLATTDIAVCHNWQFDRNVVVSEMLNHGFKPIFKRTSKTICTMKYGTDICKLPNPKFGGAYKWPTLPELYKQLTGEKMEDKFQAHDAMGDVGATTVCFIRLLRTSPKLVEYLKGETNELYS